MQFDQSTTAVALGKITMAKAAGESIPEGWALDADGNPLAMATTAAALQAHWLVVLLYLVGALAVVYHWCNGLWTAAITWGITISVRAQKQWGVICSGLAVALTVFTVGAIVGALRYEVSDAEHEAIKQRVSGAKTSIVTPADEDGALSGGGEPAKPDTQPEPTK